MGTKARSDLLPVPEIASGGFRPRGGMEDSRKARLEFPRTTALLKKVSRSEWQWFSIVATMLVLRFERHSPPGVVVIVGLTFLIVAAFPIHALLKEGR